MVHGSINIKGVFMIKVPKRNDMYLKDFKEQLWIFIYFTLLQL